jgi:large subunit ribosomal protein L6e
MARNSELAPHVGRLSRSAVFAKRGNFKAQKTSTAQKQEKPVEEKKKSKLYPVSTSKRLPEESR